MPFFSVMIRRTRRQAAYTHSAAQAAPRVSTVADTTQPGDNYLDTHRICARLVTVFGGSVRALESNGDAARAAPSTVNRA